MQISFHNGTYGSFDAHPLRLFVVADLGLVAGDTASLTAPGDLNDLLARGAPALLFEVPDLLGGTVAPFEVRLVVRTLRDLTPVGICDQLPALGRARELLDLLCQIAEGKQSASSLEGLAQRYEDLPRVREALTLVGCRPTGDEVIAQGSSARTASAPRISPTPTRAEPAQDGSEDASVDRILALVDVPQTQAKASAAVDVLVGHLSRKQGGLRGASSTVQQAKEQVARLLGAQLDVILHHDQFRRLESAWRGLKFLVERCDFRRNVRVQLLQASRPDLVELLRRELVAPCERGEVEPPDLVVVAGCELQDPELGAEIARELGRCAEAVQAPALFAVSPALWEADGRSPLTAMERPQCTKWNALRSKPCARWLAAVTNRFLLRSPYEPETSRGLLYQERLLGDADRLWGDPVWAVAAQVAASFRLTEWPTLVLGPDGRVEGLPIRPVELQPGRLVNIPLRQFLGEQLVADLARCGVIALACRRNSDAAQLVRAPTLYRSEGQPSSRGVDALPYQLFVAHIVHAVARFRRSDDALRAGSVEAFAEALRRYLTAMIASTGPGAYVDVESVPETVPGENSIHLDLRVGQFMLAGARVELDFRVGV